MKRIPSNPSNPGHQAAEPRASPAGGVRTLRRQDGQDEDASADRNTRAGLVRPRKASLFSHLPTVPAQSVHPQLTLTAAPKDLGRVAGRTHRATLGSRA